MLYSPPPFFGFTGEFEHHDLSSAALEEFPTGFFRLRSGHTFSKIDNLPGAFVPCGLNPVALMSFPSVPRIVGLAEVKRSKPILQDIGAIWHIKEKAPVAGIFQNGGPNIIPGTLSWSLILGEAYGNMRRPLVLQ